MTNSSEFTESVKQWLQANYPKGLSAHASSDEYVWGGRKEKFVNPLTKVWFEAVRDKGWLAPTWPEEFGGAGLSEQQEKIITRQMQALGCRPPIMSLGIHMMGPTIMEYGTEAQKIEYLPKIARGDIRWCQGYSEPGAGSDLASLKCKAELVGDEYIVNGQKVWTSFADKSDFLFCLVRTDFSATKHNGISVLLIDMESAGVTARPIELISGTSHFCEVFLDNVKVPKENLLGELNKGWTIAKRMLQHERNMMGKSDLGDPFRPDLAELAIQYIGVKDGRIGNGELRAQIVANKIQHHVIEATSARVLAEMKAGSMGAASSIMKYALTIAAQEKFELMLNVLGNKALGWQDEESFAEDELRTAKEWAFSKVQTIGGGTSEVQLNIIAKHILGLPD
jgi:alkylation response protein AidB-like acyl-CoA dehydrogenase